MKLLITGSKGQLGTELNRLGTGHELLAVGHDALDICDASVVSQTMADFCPDVVINAAAYTAVDKAESDSEAAFAVNRDGPANLAKACAQMDVPLIHVSTDYVFDGAKQGAWVEDDPVSPLGVYGDSKLAGEDAVRQACSKHLIFRTSWVFSAHGNNFVKTMLQLAAERDELGVVADQFGKPTSAGELARIILAVLPDMEGSWGTYHVAQPDVTSWHGFASAIFDEARAHGVALRINQLRGITTGDYPTPAKRPVNSELGCHKIENVFNIGIKHWRESLAEVIKEFKYG